MTTPPVGIGDVVAQKYIIEHIVGQGGMGVVFAALHTELDHRVAIKFLLPEFAEQSMAAERFRREARAVARMRGEHVCRVLDVGTLDSGIPFMVMEYLEGHDLSSELAARGQLPLEEAAGYVLEACEAVAEAHAAGIIHRDLKPANLFLERRSDGSRRLKVLDFGVSKSLLELKDGHGVLTQTSNLVGSPLYMSPEQLDSARDVDERADIWALGIVMFELLTGNTPFQGDTIPQLVAAVLQDSPLRTSQLRAALPEPLVRVLERALAKPREQRYASVAELAEALAVFAPASAATSVTRVRRLIDSRPANLGRELPALGLAPSPSVTPIHDAHSRDGATFAGVLRARAGSRRRALAGAVLALALAAVSYVLLRRAASPEAASRSVATVVSAAAGSRAQPPPADEVPAATAVNAELRAGDTEPGVVAPVAEPSIGAKPAARAQPTGASLDESLREPPTGERSVPRAVRGVAKPSKAAAAAVTEPAPPEPGAGPSPRHVPPTGEISDFGGRR